ncbi:hypothetical protein KJ359_010108 [Pestalotiopsis sp. 9143b]|nr:hypothetical protein KJ359_010108 [Pestalotiopsis sp. 9143b]
MDPLRPNVPDYYTPQQYTPIPLPTYPPPTFGTPSPYAGHHLQNQNHHPAIQYNPSRHLGQAQLVTPAPAPAQAPVQAPVPTPAPKSTSIRTPQQNTRAGVRSLDAEGNDGTPATGERPLPGPKGFGRTSAIYRLDESGKKRRAHAEDFRAEVEERTRNGESCEQIADALIAQGAQVTAKSVGRWRILWGFRKRAVRKQSKPPKPKDQRISTKKIWQSRFKADITRMTQQGLSSEEIARIMTGRGMELKKGSSTIARLQTVWQLRGTAESRVKNKRYLARRKARQLQLEEFQNYARELVLENPDEWVKEKMNESAIQQMRRDVAYQLMGNDAPQPKEPKAKSTRRPQTRASGRRSTGGVDPSAVDPELLAAGDDADSSDNDSEEITADVSAVPRTLRPGRVSEGTAIRDDFANDDSESSDEDAEYLSMDGVTFSEGLDHNVDGHNVDGDAQHDYQPLLEQDEFDEDDAESEEEPAPVAPAQATGIFTNAVMAPVPLDEERQDMNKLMNSTDGYIAAAQLLKDLLQAKLSGQPGPHSMTGLPPSQRDVDAARNKLKIAAQTTLAML